MHIPACFIPTVYTDLELNKKNCVYIGNIDI